MKHEPDQALADVSKALQLSPRCDLGLRARALAWMAKGDYAQAITDFDEILKRNPGDRLQLLYRSGLHYVRGDYTKALADLRLSTIKDPLAEKWLQDAAAGKEGASSSGSVPLTAERKHRMLLGDFNTLDKDIDSDVHLDSQGLIDFVRANNDHRSHGVTPQNNAAVPLFEAFGPVATPWTESDDYYRMLQMRQPPERGSYLVTLANFEVQYDKRSRPGILDHPASAEAWKPFASALERPWAKDEFPRLARCIAANRIPLSKIVDASHRSKYYLPVIDTYHELPALSICASEIRYLKEAVQLLAARAMLNLGEGNVNDAWRDTVAIFRLSRLAAQGPGVIDFLFGVWMHERACLLTASIAHFGKLTRDRCGVFREELRQLPKFQSVGQQIRYGERYVFLDIAQRSARLGPLGFYLAINAISQLSFDPIKGENPHNGGRSDVTIWFYNESVDWDEVMRLGNAKFEAAARIFEQPTREKRNAARDAIVEGYLSENQRFDQTGAFKQWSYYIIFTGLIPRQVTSADFAQCCVRLAMPGLEALCDVEDHCRVNARVTEIALRWPRFAVTTGPTRSVCRNWRQNILRLSPRIPSQGVTFTIHHVAKGTNFIVSARIRRTTAAATVTTVLPATTSSSVCRRRKPGRSEAAPPIESQRVIRLSLSCADTSSCGELADVYGKIAFAKILLLVAGCPVRCSEEQIVSAIVDARSTTLPEISAEIVCGHSYRPQRDERACHKGRGCHPLTS